MNLYTCCKLNENNYLCCCASKYVQSAVWYMSLFPLTDYHSIHGVKGHFLQLWDKTSLYCAYPTSTPMCMLSQKHMDTERGEAVCHVNIIQSDVWLICFPFLITLHINSYYQHACISTSWASEEINIWICNHVPFKLHHMHRMKWGDN